MKKRLLKSIGLFSLLVAGLVAGAAKLLWYYEPKK